MKLFCAQYFFKFFVFFLCLKFCPNHKPILLTHIWILYKILGRITQILERIKKLYLKSKYPNRVMISKSCYVKWIFLKPCQYIFHSLQGNLITDTNVSVSYLRKISHVIINVIKSLLLFLSSISGHGAICCICRIWKYKPKKFSNSTKGLELLVLSLIVSLKKYFG